MELTRDEAIRNFREHWGSLAITGSHDKKEYLRRNGYSDIIYDCFLCQFARVAKDNDDCSKCPVKWTKTHEPSRINKEYACMASYFDDWVKAEKPEERSRLAALIRDLPEKAEKVEETKSAPKFQVGQKVVPINKTAVSVSGNSLIPFEHDPYWKRGKEQGYLFIREVLPHEHAVKNGQFVYSCSDVNHGIGNYYCESDLIPYIEPPKCKFKVGDIIKGNDPDRHGYTNSDMTKGEVVELVDNGIIRIKILEHKKDLCIGDSFGVEEKYFDLVVDEPKEEPKPDPEPNKFSVGDKVKCIRVYDNKEEALGKIGKIIDASKMGNYYTVQFDEAIDGHSGMYKGVEGADGYCWCFKPDYLELAQDEPKPAFKVGDRVRVKQDLQIGQGKPDKATVVESMLRHAGKTALITGTYRGFGYRIDCDNSAWVWTSEMLEPFPINYAPENKTVVTQSVTYKFEGAKTTCIIQSEFGVFKGCAKCNPTDEWHEETGKQWAYLRANKKMIELTERVLREG